MKISRVQQKYWVFGAIAPTAATLACSYKSAYYEPLVTEHIMNAEQHICTVQFMQKISENNLCSIITFRLAQPYIQSKVFPRTMF